MEWTVKFSELGITAKANDGDNLLDVIRANDIDITADCGGRGRCGKCIVIADGERRLACETIVRADMDVTIPKGGEDYDILAGSDFRTERNARQGHDSFVTKGAKEPSPCVPSSAAAAKDTAVAVDIGTTTVVTKLIDLATVRELWASAALNAQRPYGADVISRINLSMDDSSQLSGIITAQVGGMISGMLKDSGVRADSVRRVVIAGNTTMSYLLLGLPCRSLGLAPFKPAFSFKSEYLYNEVFHPEDGAGVIDAPVRIMPFISAYVGGDITAGLLERESLHQGDAELRGKRHPCHCEERSDETIHWDAGADSYILVDMGTNGEIVYRRGDRFLCTSTAAGPAFEGGNISCGSGSVEGAIAKARVEGGKFVYETIGGAPARSVCGSGLLDIMACFVSEGIIDATGLMNADSPHVADGAVVITDARPNGGELVALTQKDVREFQLAKSAVRSGIETLIGELGGAAPDRLYLAGGFGQRLDADSALATGLLPESVRGLATPIGNSSLAGAELAAADGERFETAARIAAAGEEINLAAHPRFNQLFMEHMMF